MARSPPPSRGQALKVLEGFFDADEQQVQIPQLGGVVFGEIGAQEIAPLAPARPSQPIAVEVVGKGDALRRYRDDDQAPRGWGMGSGSAEFHQQFLAAERHH
jgi:hypothetical protein